MHGERMTKEREISIKEGKYNKNKNYRKNSITAKVQTQHKRKQELINQKSERSE